MFKSLLLTSALVTLSTLFNTCKASSHGAEEKSSCNASLVIDKTNSFAVWSLKEDASSGSTPSLMKGPVDKPTAAETSLASISSTEITGPALTGPLTTTPEGGLLLYFGTEACQGNAKVLKFTSPEQMLDMSQRLLDLAFAKKDDLVLKLCTACYESPPDRALGDIERFWFRSITAQSLVHLRLAEENKEAAREHYERIISLMNGYEQFFKGRQCNPTTQGKIETNFIDLCHFACKAYGHLTSHYDADSSVSKEAVYAAALKSMHYGEDSIQRIKALTKKAKREKNAVLAKFLETKESLIPSLRDNLIKTYFTAYQFTYLNGQPLLYNNYRARIEELHAELKKSEEFRQNSIKIMDALRLFENSKKITSGVLKKHKKVRAAESTVELLQLLEPQDETEKLSKSEEMNLKWKKIISQIELDMNTAIAKRTTAQPNAVSFNSLTLIAELENMIFKTIDSSENITSKILDPRFVITKTKHFSVISLRDTIAEIRNIYREYRQIFGSSVFNSSYYQYPMAFLCAGDIDGALARVNAFDAVLVEHNETPDALGRCVAALVKSLHGDYADLLTLEIEAKEAITKQKNERNKAKENAHTARLSSISSMRTERAAEEAARLIEKQKADERRLVKMQERTQAVFAVSNDPYYDDAISTAQSKAEKRRRHEEAQRKKVTEAEAAYEDSFSTDKKLSTAASDTSESDNEISASKLSELYSLRGTALAVNDKIESGSWDFTRHDLVAYYEAMGCEKRSGKGSHEVIEFANSFMFLKDGEVITVLSDFGGALTLPRWENTVPYYLRKQIQVAQEKLTRLAQKATHGLEKG